MKLGVLACVATFATVAAAAPTKDQCVDADTWGQSHRQHGQLHAARADFRVCVDPSCPALVRSDCRERIEEIDRVMPTVVVEAPADLDRVSITMDGVPLTPGAAPIEVDPGRHHFVLRAGERPPLEHDVLVDEGDKARRVTFDRAAWLAPPPAPASQKGPGMAPLRVAGIVTGAVGLVGIGFGAAFGVASFGAWGQVKSECPQAAQCDVARATADRQRALDFATASDVAFVIGGVLAAGGIALFVLGGSIRASAAPSAAGLSFTRTF